MAKEPFKLSEELAEDFDGAAGAGDDDAAAGAGGDEDEDEDDDQGGADADAGGDDSEEDQARRLGWVPESEWRGKKGGWVPAADFLERSYRNRGLYEGSVRKLQKQVSSLETALEESRKRQEESGEVLRNIYDRFKQADQAGYDRAHRELEQRRMKAIEDGDVDAVRKIEGQQAENRKKQADAANKPKDGGGQQQQRQAPKRDPIIQAWAERNPWFDADIEMAKAAEGIEVVVNREKPGLTTEERLNEVAKRIKKRFPEKFENDADDHRRDTTGRDLGRDRGGRGGSRGRTWADLPADAKQAYEKLARTIKGYTKAEYVRDYEWD